MRKYSFSTYGFHYENTQVWGSERDNPYVATLKILVTKLLVIGPSNTDML